MFSSDTYKKRRDELRKLMPGGIVFFPGNVETPFNYPDNTYSYRQDSNFLYYFGLQEPGLAGVMDIDNGTECLFGDDSTIDDIIWMGQQPSMADKAASIMINQTQPYATLTGVLQKAQQQGRTIHFLPPYRAETKIHLWEMLGLPAALQKEKASEQLIKAVVKMRMLKEPQEIVQIEAAIDVCYQMHTYVMKHAHAGMLEAELSGAIEGIAVSNGGQIAFPVILTINGQILHNHYHGNTLCNRQLLITDAGAETALGYAGDITRTMPVSGQFDARQKAIYQTVLQANLKGIEMSRPGTYNKEVHLAAARVIADGLKNIGVMRGNIEDAVALGAHTLFFPHGLGHAMGLDVHDMEGLGENYVGYDETISRSTEFGLRSLRFARRMESGFVLTVEPGIYFIPALIDKWEAEKKFAEFINYDVLKDYRTFGGVRIEDDILITDSGCRVLGKPIPKTIEEIVNQMDTI
jgi:Xaa-Pro aminopeptidase